MCVELRRRNSEVWKEHPYFTDYEISTFGRIRRATDGKPIAKKGNPIGKPSTKKGRLIRIQKGNRGGYCGVVIVDPTGGKKSKLVHRLVLETFLGPCPIGCETNHKNGIKDDNHVNNLEWIPHSKNVKLAYENGLQPTIQEGRNILMGELCPRSKLKENQVIEIKRLLSNPIINGRKITQTEMAKIFKVSNITISDIKSGKSWKHL